MLENNSHRLMFAAMAIVFSGAILGTVHAAYPDATNVILSKTADVLNIDQSSADTVKDQSEYKTLNFYGKDNGEAEAYINSSATADSDVTIPSKVKIYGKEYTVTTITSSRVSQVKSLTLPDTITTIGSSAFSGLTISDGNLTIPNSVTTISTYAFSKLKGVDHISIPNSVTTMQDDAFYNANIKTIKIGNGVTSIPANAFYGSTLESVEIPGNVKTIGDSAFSQSKNLQSITLDEGIETINTYAFEGTNVTNLRLPDSVKNVGNWFVSNADWNKTVSVSASKNTVFSQYALSSYAKLTEVR